MRIALLSLVACAAPAADTPDAGNGYDWTALETSIQHEMSSEGAAIAIVYKGQVVYAKGFGNKWVDAANGDPIATSTLFKLASITKPVTTLALLGQLPDPNATVESVLPWFGNTAMTFDELLTHRAGMVDTTQLELPGTFDDGLLASYFQGNDYSQASWFHWAPGQAWAYANDHFNLAGLAVQTLAGKPYADAVHDLVLAPLGMTHSFFRPTDITADGDYTNGQTLYRDGTTEARPDGYLTTVGYPSAGLWSSLDDVEKLALYLLEQHPYTMLDVHAETGLSYIAGIYDHPQWGYGMHIFDGILDSGTFYPVHVVGHDGSAAGFSSMMELVPDQDFAFISLANRGNVYFDHSLKVALETVGALPAATAPPAYPTDLDALVGTYIEPTKLGQITITRSGTALAVSIPALDAAGIAYPTTITPKYGTTFDFPGVHVNANFSDNEITFEPSADGSTMYLVNRWWTAARQ